jgi:hypothetical protein
MALGYAEYSLLPESAIIAALALLGLLVLYFQEPRWAVLSIPAANRLGFVVGVVALVWSSWRVGHEWFDPLLPHMDWSSLLAALLGPLVMVLMPAKLLRRDKHIGDYWWLHGLALATATLAAAIVDDVVGFALIALYALCALRHWHLLHTAQLAGMIDPIPGYTSPPVHHLNPTLLTPSSWSRSIGPLAIAAILAIVIYWATPPSPVLPSLFGRPRIEIGFAADQMVNLTYTGKLESNPTPLFEVEAMHPDGTPAQLSPLQRWRGREFRMYTKGRWETGNIRLPTIIPAVRQLSPWRPPQFGPHQLILTFRWRSETRTPLLAHPLYWQPTQPVPIVSLSPQHPEMVLPWQWLGDGGFFLDTEEAETWPYRQYWHPPESEDLSPPFYIVDPERDRLLRALTQNPLAPLRDYADALVNRWIHNGQLPADLIDPALLRPRRRYHERLARLLCAHLRQQAGLRYTTELQIARKDIDPLEDFLFYSKAGHCERFASALVLLLRSQGIPAQLVLGCQGCEPLDRPGLYLVRHEHAHAWVECLIEEYEPPTHFGMRPVSRWLTLDPTPSAPPDENNTSHWLRQGHRQLQQHFRHYLLHFSTEQRQQTLDTLTKMLRPALPFLPALCTCLLLTAIVLRFSLKSRKTPTARRWPQLLDELFAALSPLHVLPQPGETAATWAERCSEALQRCERLAAWADLPLIWIRSYYAQRFGEQQLPADHWQQLQRRLAALKQLLRQYQPSPSISAGTKIPPYTGIPP